MKVIRRISYIVNALLLVGVSGAAFAAPTTIALEEVAASSGLAVSIVLTQPEEARRPILAEIRVEFESAMIEFRGGEGTVEGKHVTIVPIAPGVIRVTELGQNLVPMDGGQVAVLNFAWRGNKIRTWARIDPETSRLDRKAAESGIVIAPVLKLGPVGR